MPANSIYLEQTVDLFILVGKQERPFDMPFAHYHNSYEIYILESGTRNYIIDDDLFEISEMDVALINPYVLHKTTGGAFRRTLISINPSYLKKHFSEEVISYLLEPFNHKVISLNNNLYLKLHSVCQMLFATPEEDRFVYVAELLVLLKNASKSCPTDKKIISSNEKQVAEIVKLIHSNYLEIKNLDDICNHFFITKGHLCRIFKKTLNMSVISYLNNVKVQNACELLANTNKNITEVGFETGFNSTMYFCKTFKKYLGISPLEYRKKMQKPVN